MKNFNQMSSKKLNMLLEDEATTPEEVEAINEVLAKRAAALNGGADQAPSNTPSEQADDSGLSPEEQAAIDAAEEANGTKPVEKKAKVVKPAMTDEERAELAEKLRAGFLYHRCEVVPFNTVEWVPGVVVGILEDTKKNRVMIAIKTDDGRRMVKAHDSQLYKVLEEVAGKPANTRRTPKLDENGNPIASSAFTPWTPEELEEEVQKYIVNVGKTVSFMPAGAFGKAVEGTEPITGRIIGLVPEKRNNTILYRIKPDGEDSKYVHKVAGTTGLTIAEEFDDEGAEMNESYVTRHNNRINGISTSHKGAPAKNPAEALAQVRTALAASKAKLAHLTEKITRLEGKLPEAEAAYAKYLAEGGTPLAEDASKPAETAGTSENDGEDLM